jgi:phospholipase/lecithinase/hemolysin
MKTRIVVIFCWVCLGMMVAGQEVSAGELYVFGDSLSDTGNLFLLTGGTNGSVFTPDPSQSPRLPTPPYYNGRASNGPVWIEQFAALLGLPAPQPVVAGGTNYSFIGAVTGPGSTSPYPIPTIKAQVDTYVGSATPAAPDDLFVVWGGANDFLYGQTDPVIPVTNVVHAIETLHAQANASRFLIPNLPPLGRTPTGAALDATGYDLLSTQFNTLLDTELDTLRNSLGVSIYEFDVFSRFEDLLNDPAAFGLTNVTESALVLNEDTASPLFGYPMFPYTFQHDPDTSLFFDGVHPTTRGHELLAEAAAASVPEPATLVMCLTGLAMFTLGRWRWTRRRDA